jgi:hypothetical protein
VPVCRKPCGVERRPSAPCAVLGPPCEPAFNCRTRAALVRIPSRKSHAHPRSGTRAS